MTEASHQAASKTPQRLPLSARRTILIGVLAVLGGVFASQLLTGAQFLAVAGLVTVLTGLSTSGTAGQQPLMWLTAAFGAVWVGATIAYWLPILDAVNKALPQPASASSLFVIGLCAFIAMIISTGFAFIRRVSARRVRNKEGAS